MKAIHVVIFEALAALLPSTFRLIFSPISLVPSMSRGLLRVLVLILPVRLTPRVAGSVSVRGIVAVRGLLLPLLLRRLELLLP